MIVIHTKYNIQFIKTHLLYIRINKLLKTLKKKKRFGNFKNILKYFIIFFFFFVMKKFFIKKKKKRLKNLKN